MATERDIYRAGTAVLPPDERHPRQRVRDSRRDDERHCASPSRRPSHRRGHDAGLSSSSPRGPRADQSRIWDAETGTYTQPANQPQALTPDQNIWSSSHAYLDDPGGTILVAGGFRNDKNNPVLTIDTERRAFTFDPTTLRWSTAADLHANRFYPPSITLADGRVLVLQG
jgi:hypothetical protein